MIRGKKNFLPPHPLVMGFGLLFRLDESSLGSHLNERRVRGEEEGIDDTEENASLQEEPDTDSEKEVTEEKISAKSERVPDSTTENFEQASESTAKDNFTHDASAISSSRGSGHDNFRIAQNGTLNGGDGNNIADGLVNGAASMNPQLDDLIDRALGLGSASQPSMNYRLQASQSDSLGERNQEEKKVPTNNKPHTSKAERRKLKKGMQSNVSAETLMDEGVNKSKESGVSADHSEKQVQSVKPGGGKISRGQRSKLKKMKEKYADQDEEERSIRMALLAVS